MECTFKGLRVWRGHTAQTQTGEQLSGSIKHTAQMLVPRTGSGNGQRQAEKQGNYQLASTMWLMADSRKATSKRISENHEMELSSQ